SERILANWRIPETFTYDWEKNEARTQHLNISLPESVTARNHSVYGHVIFEPLSSDLPKITTVARLNVFRPRPKLNTKINLISGQFGDERLESASQSGESIESVREQIGRDSTWQSYWRPLLHARLLVDQTTYPAGGIPTQLRNAYRLDP
ncbi:hypothetical protein BVRB_028090, partial [Beta vulgaris subsp. vulgaris]